MTVIGALIDISFLVLAIIYSYQGKTAEANHMLLFLIACNVSSLASALRGGVDLKVTR